MRERDIFLAALDIGNLAERSAFLAKACGSDHALYARITELFVSHDNGGEFLARPAQVDAAVVDALNQFVEQQNGSSKSAAPMPEQIGDYRLVRLIGRGGMGSVYEAIQQSLGRRVALKVMDAAATHDPRALTRFEREARAAARLHHTNIVPVYEVNIADGIHFYAMQYISGEALDELIGRLRATSACPTSTARLARWDRAPTSAPTDPLRADRETASYRLQTYWGDAARIGWQLADALAYAHRERVLHRDVKPANVLLDGQGTAWITDFGVAKSEESNLTRTGDVIGTMRFMAPERFRGVSDARTDVYGLGMTLYELATWRAAFAEGSSADLLAQILHSVPQAPRLIAPQMPRDFDTILRKSVAKAPEDRYGSMEELRDDLGRFLEGRPIQARRISPAEALTRWCRRNPAVAALLGTVAMLAVATIAILAVSNVKVRKSEAAKAAALVTERRALSQREAALRDAEASEERARRRLYASQLSMAGAAYRDGDWGRATNLLESQIPASGQRDLRGFEWRYLWRALHRGLRRSFQQAPGEIHSLRFSPDGKQLAVCSGNITDAALQLWDVAEGNTTDVIARGNPLPEAMAFSPDGKQLLVGMSTGELRAIELATLRVIRRYSAGDLIKSVDWSPDGKFVACGCERGVLLCWRSAEPSAPFRRDELGGPVRHLSFSHDSEWLFASSMWGSEGPLTRGYRLSAEATVKPQEAKGVVVVDASSRTGERISFDWSSVLIESLAGRRIELIPQAAQLSPDGQRFVTAGHDDRMAILWDRHTRQRLVQGAHRTAVWASAIDPQQRSWATGSLDGEVRIWRYDLAPLTEKLAHDPPVKFVLSDRADARMQRQSGILLSGDFPAERWRAVGDQPQPIGKIGHVRLADSQGELLVGFRRDQAAKRTEVTLWKRSTGAQQTSFVLPDEAELAYNAVALSSTGRWLATRTWDGPVRLFDLSAEPPRQVGETPDLECIDLAFSPDDKALAAACQFGRVAAIEVPSGKRLPDLTGEESKKLWAQQVVFSPDGKLLAASNDVGLVRVYDFATRRVVANLVGHQGEINDLAFFPDSRRLAVAGVGPLRIWDTEIEQELLSLPAGEKTYSITITTDGGTLCACDGEGTVYVWRAE